MYWKLLSCRVEGAPPVNVSSSTSLCRTSAPPEIKPKLSGLSFWCRAPKRFLTSPFIWRHISKVDYKLKNGVAPFIPIQPDSLFQRAGVGVGLDAVQLSRRRSLAGKQSIHYSAAGSLFGRSTASLSIHASVVFERPPGKEKYLRWGRFDFTVSGIQRSLKQPEQRGDSTNTDDSVFD